MQEPAKARPTREGKCELCGETLSKRVMSRHLQSCREKNPPKTSGSASLRKDKVFHVVAEGRDLPDYWMHLEARAEATLLRLDGLLREVWLECCGHMSAFTIEKTRYSVAPLVEWEERGMNIPLEKILRPGMKFYHDYDFGTTTHLALKVISEKEQLVGKKTAWVLARNLPPQIPCDLCDKLATRVCSSCWGNEKWVCDDCAPKHECGAEMLLPVVNSPRSGMCGYDGYPCFRWEE